MKAVLIGASGKMGQAVLSVAKNGEIVAGIDIVSTKNIVTYDDIYSVKEPFDTIIDFASAFDRSKTIEFAAKNNIFYCCFSTTVFDLDLAKLKEMEMNGGACICFNASRGIFALKFLASGLARLLKDADVVVEDIHHKNKKDSPSGTAKDIAKLLEDSGVNSQIISVRAGSEFGTHSIKFFLEDEAIEIVHRAYSRRIFAQGALEIAREKTKHAKCNQ